MIELKGINGESLVLDGEWVEKLRLGNSRARNPVSSYRETSTNEFSRRKKLFRGEKEQLIQIVVSCQNHMSLIVPAEQRAEVDRFVAELERASKESSA